MSEATDFAKLRRVPPAEAIAYMQGRETATVTYNAAELWQDEHSRQFTISRLSRADLVQAMQASIAKSVQGDLTRRDWIRSSEKLLQDAGWWGTKEVTDPRTGEVVRTTFNHSRLQLIFDVNVRQAASAGQWDRMQRNKRTHPYVTYMSKLDGRERPAHGAWHGVTLPVGHPWLLSHWAPNGYRCRCWMVAKTQREYDAGVMLDRPGAATDPNAPVRSMPMIKQAPAVNLVSWENPATGQLQYVPEGIDPGFDYNPGAQGRSEAFDAMVQAKLARLSPEVANAARAARLTTGLPSEAVNGQRPGLSSLPDVRVLSVSSDAIAPGLAPAQAMAAATRDLRLLQASDGLVNDDSGWLLSAAQPAAAGDRPEAAPLALAALRELVRLAVVAERSPAPAGAGAGVLAVYRLLAPLRIDDQAYRIALTVQQLAAGAGRRQVLHTLDSVAIDGTLSDAAGRLISVRDLLRGALRGDGQPFSAE